MDGWTDVWTINITAILISGVDIWSSSVNASWDDCIPDQSPLFLLRWTLRGSRWWLRSLGPYHPHERPRWRPGLLSLVWFSPHCCRHLRTGPANGRFLSLCLSPFCLSHKMKINTLLKLILIMNCYFDCNK